MSGRAGPRLSGHPWFYPGLFGVLALAFLVGGIALRNVALPASGAVTVGLGVAYLPALRVASVSLDEARARAAAEGAPVVYWRPGCRYSMSLIRELTPAQRRGIAWVNVWRDPTALAELRGLHLAREGREHEAVPTAVVAGESFVVASEAAVRRLTAPLAPGTTPQENP